MEIAYFNWSSGKDSSLALYRAICSDKFVVEALFSVLKSDSEEIAMHGVSIELLKKQAESIGIPLVSFDFDSKWTVEEYESAMSGQINRFKEQNSTTALFGDLRLEQLRKSREQKCNKAGIQAEFPLWNTPAKELMSEFIRLGFKAIIICVNKAVLSEEFVGKIIDEEFLKEFPPDVDICGENGEYHTFVFDGPIFKYPIEFKVGNKYCKQYRDPETKDIYEYCYLALE